MSHTQGPWIVSEKLILSENHRGWAVGPAGSRKVAEVFPLGSDPTAEAKANARLISSAPELLKALKAIDECLLDSKNPIDRPDLWNPKFLKAHDLAATAIAKAEGK